MFIRSYSQRVHGRKGLASEAGSEGGIQEATSNCMKMELLIAPGDAASRGRKHSCEESMEQKLIRVNALFTVLIKSFPLGLERTPTSNSLKVLAPKNGDH